MIPFGDSNFLGGSAGHLMRAVMEEYFGFGQLQASANLVLQNVE